MNFKKKVKEATFKEVLILVGIIVLMLFILMNYSWLWATLMTFLDVIKPFIYGVCIAFVFNIPMQFFMRKLPPKKDGRKPKLLAALITLLCFIIVITLIIWIIVPRIVDNIMLLVNNFDSYIAEVERFIEILFENMGLSNDLIDGFINSLGELGNQFVGALQSLIPAMFSILTMIASSITNVVFSILIAMYLIISKETLIRQGDRIGKALLNEKRYHLFKELMHLISDTFASFISGQGIEAVIIGVLCYIGCKILGFEYASIVSVIIGVTNMIPIFGAIIGTAFSALLIAFVNPVQGLIFLVFGVCLQQFESNLIYPHVVGSSIGLPPLWVLFAVTLGGGLFGVAGMLFGLPTFSVIYEIFRRYIIKKEKMQNEIKRMD
ncbi:AI-2E family transporter [uncultured Traorella sp.]|uniref:AI-2E family transporter n=1 Tax=uncultured Traorella sp. TaxID=1929048 RepID=UPI0025DB8DFB|nr:AI-2E family transporter [uncultured Traorella sp.]